MPGSNVHVTQIPLTDQASSGCCSSAPSKLAWLVETGVQYVLQRAALLHIYAAAQSASCLPAAGGCRRFQSCIAESSGSLSNVLNTRCGSCLDHCLLQHVSSIKQPVTRSEALTTSASAAEAARHICVAARHRAEPGTLVGSPLGLMSHACQNLLCRNCALRVPPPLQLPLHHQVSCAPGLCCRSCMGCSRQSLLAGGTWTPWPLAASRRTGPATLHKCVWSTAPAARPWRSTSSARPSQRTTSIPTGSDGSSRAIR